MSHRLKQRGLAHLVLERHRIAERWRSERWDGLRFQFPNWSVRLPDFPFPHSDPDGFATSRRDRGFHQRLCRFHRGADPLRRIGGRAATPRWRSRLCCRNLRSVRSRPTMSSSPPVPTSGRSCRPGCAMTPASFRCTPAGTETPISFHRARCWWSAPAPPARKSPRSCCARAAASFSRSAGTAACRADTADAT